MKKCDMCKLLINGFDNIFTINNSRIRICGCSHLIYISELISYIIFTYRTILDTYEANLKYFKIKHSPVQAYSTLFKIVISEIDCGELFDHILFKIGIKRAQKTTLPCIQHTTNNVSCNNPHNDLCKTWTRFPRVDTPISLFVRWS